MFGGTWKVLYIAICIMLYKTVSCCIAHSIGFGINTNQTPQLQLEVTEKEEKWNVGYNLECLKNTFEQCFIWYLAFSLKVQAPETCWDQK
jgi:hypothetical protein